jgi:hypothetical protein
MSRDCVTLYTTVRSYRVGLLVQLMSGERLLTREPVDQPTFSASEPATGEKRAERQGGQSIHYAERSRSICTV